MTILRITTPTGIFLRDDFTHDPETEIALDVAPAQGFYLPKWDGEQWVEGGTPPNEIPVTEPTIEERISAVESDITEIATILSEVI